MELQGQQGAYFNQEMKPRVPKFSRDPRTWILISMLVILLLININQLVVFMVYRTHVTLDSPTPCPQNEGRINMDLPKFNETQKNDSRIDVLKNDSHIDVKSPCSAAVHGVTDNTRILNLVDGKALDFLENEDEEMPVFVVDVELNSVAQQWVWSSEFRTLAGSSFTSLWIKNGKKRVLHEEQATGLIYATVERETGNQRWTGVRLASGAFQIKNKKSGRCLTSFGEMQARAFDCSIHDERQQWCLVVHP